MAFKVGPMYVRVLNDKLFMIDRWSTDRRRKNDMGLGDFMGKMDHLDEDVRHVDFDDLLPLEV